MTKTDSPFCCEFQACRVSSKTAGADGSHIEQAGHKKIEILGGERIKLDTIQDNSHLWILVWVLDWRIMHNQQKVVEADVRTVIFDSPASNEGDD
jgi:hypothetical protein